MKTIETIQSEIEKRGKKVLQVKQAHATASIYALLEDGTQVRFSDHNITSDWEYIHNDNYDIEFSQPTFVQSYSNALKRANIEGNEIKFTNSFENTYIYKIIEIKDTHVVVEKDNEIELATTDFIAYITDINLKPEDEVISLVKNKFYEIQKANIVSVGDDGIAKLKNGSLAKVYDIVVL